LSIQPFAGIGGEETHDGSRVKSVEAEVMGISYLAKLHVFDKISPPLPLLNSNTLLMGRRGPVIAIEGLDSNLLWDVSAAVEMALATTNEVSLQTWTDRGEIEDAKAEEALRTSRRGSLTTMQGLFGSYMRLIMRWQEKSRQVVQHITSPPVADVACRGGDRDSITVGERRSKTPGQAGSFPVALIKGGFRLTTSDKFACAIPIADAYLPVDHWQWVATLWRGIVGPDLVVYAKQCREDAISRTGSVEFESPGVLVVSAALGKGLDEAAERRLGFEVMEWIRGGTFRRGLAGVE
jgi:hypothetical protein